MAALQITILRYSPVTAGKPPAIFSALLHEPGPLFLLIHRILDFPENVKGNKIVFLQKLHLQIDKVRSITAAFFVELHNNPCYNRAMGKPESQGGLPSVFGGAPPPDERKEGLPMYVTYSDLVQIGIFICTLIGLCYTLFKGKRK